MKAANIIARADAEPAAVYAEAVAAATAAIRDYFANGGREGPLNCGFAWVNVRPATGKFINWCKKQSGHAYGSKAHSGGWTFWAPGKWPTAEEAGVPVIYEQDVDVKQAGARAFAAVLRDNGLDAHAASRLD
jgi:hypothetical protein